MLSFKEKREIQKQIKQGYASLVGAKFAEKRAIQKDIKSLYSKLNSDSVDTKKSFVYSVGDKVIVGNGTTDDRGTILNKDEHDTAFKGLNIEEYEAVEMSDGQVQIVGHSRMKIDDEKPTQKYTSHLATLKKETIKAKEIEDLINDDSLSNIDAEIEQGNPEALELSNALDEAIERHNTKTDSITQTLGEFGLEQHSLDDGTSILYKDSIEVFRSSDDESVGEYLDSIQWQRESIQGEGGV